MAGNGFFCARLCSERVRISNPSLPAMNGKGEILLLSGKPEGVWQVPETAEKTERQGRNIKRRRL